MSRVSASQPLLPSVLDRLIDMDPAATREPAKSQNQLLRDLKQSLRRDLENLLNTRWRCQSWPPQLDELETSLVNYGIPDFTGTNLGVAANREEFRAILEQVIRRCEPRLTHVRVSLQPSDETDRSLHFRINAVLHAEPAPEPVTFDSRVEPSSGVFQVKGGGR